MRNHYNTGNIYKFKRLNLGKGVGHESKRNQKNRQLQSQGYVHKRAVLYSR